MENQNEIWKDIPNYEGLYQVSNLGNIKGIKRNIIKKQCLNKGYKQINLCKNSDIITYPTHKLLAITFLNHKPDGHNMVIDHINGIKTDNRLENIQIITQRENTSKSKNNEFIGCTYLKKCNKWMSRIRIKEKYKHLGVFNTQKEAHNAYLKELDTIQKPKTPIY